MLFLNELRRHPVGSKLLLTAAAAITPFAGADGSPSPSVADFSKVLDFVAMMNYDLWGSWSNSVGPNAPLHDACAAPENQQGSAEAAVKAWTGAGFPANKLVLGVPSYGRALHVNKADAFVSGSTLASYPKFDKSKQPAGGDGDAPSVDVCGVQNGLTGVFTFAALVSEGYLKDDGTPADGIAYHFDDCSKTVSSSLGPAYSSTDRHPPAILIQGVDRSYDYL